MAHEGLGIVATSAALLFCVGNSLAGPCTAEIAAVERQIGATAAKPDSGATAPQSLSAQLHRQPTPSTVQSAESKANTDAADALARARKADAEGNADTCAKALNEARLLYGLN